MGEYEQYIAVVHCKDGSVVQLEGRGEEKLELQIKQCKSKKRISYVDVYTLREILFPRQEIEGE